MAAYVLSEVEILDEQESQNYRRLAAASIAEYGGRYLARGAEAYVAEGAPPEGRIVLVEFPSMERIYEWYTSPAYAKALQFRERALKRRLTFFEGILPAIPRPQCGTPA